MTFIYALKDPRSNKIRYVGKSNNPKHRFRSHVKDAKTCCKTYKDSWIVSLLKLDLKPVLVILEKIPKSDWVEREQFWISKFRALGFSLVNLTDGGNGSTGWIPTKEQKLNMSKAAKEAMNRPEVKALLSEKAKGRVASPETKAKMSKLYSGEGNSMYGRRHSKESKLKMSVNASAHRPEVHQKFLLNNPMKNPDAIAKMRASLTGRKLSEEHKTNISKGVKGKMIGELNGMFGKIHTLETKEKLSKALKGRTFSEKHIENLKSSCKSKDPEVRRKMSEARKAYWARKKGEL